MRCSRVAAVTLAGALAASLEACHDDTGPQPASAVRLTALTDTSLTGTAGGAVKPAPAVRATDERDRPQAGVAITFRVATGGGTVDGGTVTTGSDGSARLSKWTLGPSAGTQRLTASAGDEAGVTFTALATNFDDEFGGTPDRTMTADGANVAWLSEGRTTVRPPGPRTSAAIAFARSGLIDVAPPQLCRRRFVVHAHRGNRTRIRRQLGVAGSAGQSWRSSSEGGALGYQGHLHQGRLHRERRWRRPSAADTDACASIQRGRPGRHHDRVVHREHRGRPTRIRVAVMTADGVFLKDLAWPVRPAGGDGPGSLAWSPDGSGIAFSFFRCESRAKAALRRSVKYVSLDGSRLVTLIPNAQSPSWRR